MTEELVIFDILTWPRARLEQGGARRGEESAKVLLDRRIRRIAVSVVERGVSLAQMSPAVEATPTASPAPPRSGAERK